ncbi:MMPL family transporter [Acidocella facilis]|uniref:MMPL family transporter n=1 Tax=Acidocella facilis TaxID=525 RepID=UPI001F305DDA|nr:MMPL family transporter [Acidocella facilis]
MRLINSIVATASRHAVLCVLLFLVLGGLGLGYTARHLAIDTDTDHLFAASLAWRQAQIAEDKNFPQFNDLIVAVVRADTPEEAKETATALNAALQADTAHFKDSSYPSGDRFYTDEGLLLLPTDNLAKLLNQIVAAQPFLGQLAADPSARGLLDGLALITQGVQAGANISPYNQAIAGVRANLQAAANGKPVPLSWQSLIMAGAPGQGGAEFVLAHPKLQQGTLQPGGEATKALVAIAKTLPDVKAGRATVNYTGQIPLSDEQFASLTHGLVLGGIISVVLIALWLYLALRSWRLILPILLTLVMGLALTMSYAAIVVRTINLISVAFAILFIGLAVDFAIQYCVRLRAVRLMEPELGPALRETSRLAGAQIALAATATACGFLAFAPTPFVGVAELGEIAGAGMFIAFFCTISFLPALLRLFRPHPETESVALPGGAKADHVLRRHRRAVLGLFGALALAGLWGAVTLRFDANPLDTKDPNTESMRTIRSLLADPQTNPFYADALAPNLDAARALADRLSQLKEVSQAISGATFVPQDQPQKLAMLAQAQTILAPTLLAAATPPQQPVTAQEIRDAMAKTIAAITNVQSKLPKGSELLGIASVLKQLQGEDDARIMAMNEAITRFLPLELQNLTRALQAKPITQDNLPASIKADWFLPDGQVRVEAFPTAAAQTTKGLYAFSKAVLAAAPNAGGPAISTIATAGTILSSFQEAAILAFIAIAVILLAVFRNLRDSLLVLAALALSALLTALFARMAGMSINYANIIALPLLLGVGVSFNVYFVMNFRSGMRNFLASATARAVLFSALTTATAFGSLAASADRGTASMGDLLFLSLAAVLVSTFIFLPALLHTLADARKT